MKIFFAIILMMHSLIHFTGFMKAFDYGSYAQLTSEISRPLGVIWLFTGILFIVAAILSFFRNDLWLMVAFIAILISQVLIILVWKDAWYGTFVNLVILVVVLLSWGNVHFEKAFKADVKENLLRSNALKEEMLTESDLQSLPIPVQNYLRYAGVLNKPKVKNFRIVFEGEMREKGKDWFPFTAEQYNFFDEPTRLFFMKARMFGLTVPGYHRYSDAKASMDVRLFGTLPIVRHSGGVMNKTETVTLFNDMCLMAPATLIDKRIEWTSIDRYSVKAGFTNGGISISAILYFNEQGQLVDFLSEDRTAISEMKEYPFSTPVSDYANFDGIQVMTHGDAVWHYPDGKFVYGKFRLKEIEYNVTCNMKVL